MWQTHCDERAADESSQNDTQLQRRGLKDVAIARTMRALGVHAYLVSGKTMSCAQRFGYVLRMNSIARSARYRSPSSSLRT